MGPDAALHPNFRRKAWSTGLLVFMFAMSIITITLPYGRDNTLIPSDEELLKINTGDTAWMMVSCALVLFMIPGLAFFYGGMVRSINLISTLLQSIVIMGIILVVWALVGFSFAFGKDVNDAGILGNPATYFLLRGVGGVPLEELAPTIPATVYCMYQGAFAMITPALITGAVVERVNFNAMMVFAVLWHIVVYCPMAHMEWSPHGLLHTFGSHDYAGGTVVHMSAGYSAITLSLLLGKRGGDKSTHHAPSHIPYVILGTAILWVGWAGFNGGSALSANYAAGHAILMTNISASVSMITWILWDYIQGRKVSAIGVCAGAVVGLVGITPGCGFVTAGGALMIGMLTSVTCNITMRYFQLNDRFDDTLDVFAGHGTGGTVGMILTALFSTTRVYDDDLDGLFYGKAELFWKTCVTALLVIIYFVLATVILYYIVNAMITFRVSEEDEREGLDSSIHGEVVHGFVKPNDFNLDTSLNGSSYNLPLKATGGTAVTGSPVDSYTSTNAAIHDHQQHVNNTTTLTAAAAPNSAV